ncbi:hypothetical protein [Halorussus marinus]|uniref:hypothetical protein n=1 Tax=Halorussus marinus TaxID=2505976 RepID=UPI00106ED0A8|nr:hypothetical protein [Halorussus marinus]
MRNGAILLGGLAQAVVVGVLLVVIRPPMAVYAATPAVAGAVGGLASDRFQSEYVDSGGAGLVGGLLSLVVVGAVSWRNLAALPRAVQIDLTLLTVVWSFVALAFLLPACLFVSVLVGQFGVVLRETLSAQ